MSFCPSKDIHSVYLDNELPEIYKAEYEAHLKECPKCQEELAKIRKLHSLFNADSTAITPDSHYLDQSFERLQIKMKFSKTADRKSSSYNKFNFKNIGYIGAAAAAAAVFALVLPVRMTASKVPAAADTNTHNVAAMPLTANNVSFNSGKSTVISGNIDSKVLNSGNSAVGKTMARNVSTVSNNVQAAPISFKGNRDVELLRPELETISIKITLPGIDSVPITTEVQLPMDVVSGRY